MGVLKDVHESKTLKELKAIKERRDKFDRRSQLQLALFVKASELYKEISQEKKSYTYKAFFEEANAKHKFIDEKTFDKDFDKINRNYTNFRIKNLGKSS